MLYQAKIQIIDPDYYSASSDIFTFEADRPTYEDTIIAYFRQWNRIDKYDRIYALGVEYLKEENK